MKFLIWVVVVATVVVMSVWLLPWWATLAAVALALAVAGWFAWRIIATIKKEVVPALKTVAEGFPRSQERLCSVPPNERFRGNGFTFSFPVACEVSQTVIDDLEALMLKPAAAGATGLMVISTIPKDELKTRVEAQLDAVFLQVKSLLSEQARQGERLCVEEFQPTQVGPFRGECRQFRAANAEKRIRGETVYLGEPNFSVAWAVVGPEETFDSAANQYRELAGLIERVKEQPAIDVPAVGQSD